MIFLGAEEKRGGLVKEKRRSVETASQAQLVRMPRKFL